MAETSEGSPLIKGESGATGSSSSKGSSNWDAGSIFRRYIQPSAAECFGVALFVFITTGAVMANNILADGLAYGMVMAGIIAGLGSLSGGHINPAMTLASWMAGGISPVLGCCYVCAQIVGGILGAACCRGMMSYDIIVSTTLPNGTVVDTSVLLYSSLGGGVHQLGDNVTVGCGVFCEIMLTLIVGISFLMTTVDRRNPSAPLIIAFAYIVGVIAGGAISGGSMNPARSFGPAVIMSDLDSTVWQDHWVYWVGPAGGAVLAGFLYRFVFSTNDKRLILKDD